MSTKMIAGMSFLLKLGVVFPLRLVEIKLQNYNQKSTIRTFPFTFKLLAYYFTCTYTYVHTLCFLISPLTPILLCCCPSIFHIIEISAWCAISCPAPYQPPNFFLICLNLPPTTLLLIILFRPIGLFFVGQAVRGDESQSESI